MRVTERPRARILALLVGAVASALTAAACYDVEEPTSLAAVHSLDVPASIQADGATLTEISATIDASIPSSQRSVTFTTTAGKFLGAANAASSITVTPDATGKATTILQSPADTGLALVSASAGGGMVSKNVDFVAPPPTIKSVSITDSIIADGVSTTEIDVQLDASVRSTQRGVTFATTAGKLLGSANPTSVQVTADENGRAAVLLQAPSDPIVALVTLSAGNSAVSHSLHFLPDHPATIQVTPVNFSLQAGAGKEVNVIAVVRRSAGTPLAGVPVVFTARDPTNTTDIGVLTTPALTDSNGASSVRFALLNSTYLGPVIVRARTNTAEQLTDATTIVIVP